MADATTPVRRPSQTDEPTASTDHGPLTCSAASHVLDSSGQAHVSVTTGQATAKKSRIRCADAVAAALHEVYADEFGFEIFHPA